MMFMSILGYLFLFDKTISSSASSSALSASGTHGWRTPVDCVKASDMCNQSPQCSWRYRIMRQCLVGRDRNAMLASKDCQDALEVLQESPLYDCRCKRGMKKELQCLQNYWSIHMGLTEGEEFYETSPYEPMTIHHSDVFRLASIISGIDSTTAKGNQCPDQSKPCNSCLDAAKACNLNDTCKKQRSYYISTCNKEMPGQSVVPSATRAEPCNRKRCHKALRQFFDRVQTEYSYRMLFCPCQDTACAERRRQTIVPSCAFEEKVKPNCLELRKTCRSDPLCRSRLADFHMNCQTTPHSITNCPNENYQACLASYIGLIGSDMTPNYVDASYTNITISPWCTCRGSGNQEEECEKFLRDFKENTCLRNSIQAFGYGPETDSFTKPVPVTPSLSPDVELVSLSEPSVNHNDIKPGDDACVFSTCANLENGPKCNLSNDYMCKAEQTLMERTTRKDLDEGRSFGATLSTRAAVVCLPYVLVRLAL
ncbi:GDNF family receptor alpha-2-like isoform X1 [Brienomyrus brachyistius]|uniref:GDNF family receptor alpha-2-like isoform X1 n=1 Tax=Brienomyrus brachyistius TaxID=42636 RepID=UPI0020B36B12|nr:GDNF family receptor alpha-2-like isoform X1 [Brienomyrus brachyistius]